MTDRYLVEQVTSYFGLVFWSLQLAPQAWKTYRRGTSTGVSVWTMLIWSFAGMFMGVYNIEFRYQHKWSKIKTSLGFAIACLFFAGIEVGFIYAFKRAQDVQNQGAIRFFGIVPVIFVLGGFLPQYYEIFRDKRVIGVSHVFLAMDFSGSIFSTLALAFSDNMDALNLANYIAIACFDLGILFLYYFFEWYQKRYGNNSDESINSNNTLEAMEQNNEKVNGVTVKRLSYDCEDARNTTS
ncbi:unnamed protein product [Mucor hiemalis]